ncbi:DUF4249 domain-containing protein [Roseimarinus sediminis]|uniref:DUF4249 domain-containing protein n=1 Tax=Roseimarinus sediminis TaxID=1610899 RepID=UPI003D20B233
MKQNIILLLILLSILSACRKEIDFDKKLIEPKMVVNGFITNDSLITLTVAASKPIPGIERPFTWINDAKVELYVDGILSETLKARTIEMTDPNENQWYDDMGLPTVEYQSETTRGEIGKTYKVLVSHPDYETVWGETSIPTPVTPEHIEYELSNETQDEYYIESRVVFQLTLNDPANIDNYYRLAMRHKTGQRMVEYNYETDDSTEYIYVEYSSSSYIQSEDPILSPDEDANDFLFGSPSNRYNLFTDELIDGKKYQLDFYLPFYWTYIYEEDESNDEGEFYQVSLYFQTLTREAYLYMKSSYEHYWYDEDFFAEPVQTYSNIVNGAGIFAGYTSQLTTVQEGEYPIEGMEYREYGY